MNKRKWHHHTGKLSAVHQYSRTFPLSMVSYRSHEKHIIRFGFDFAPFDVPSTAMYIAIGELEHTTRFVYKHSDLKRWGEPPVTPFLLDRIFKHVDRLKNVAT